MLVNMIHSHKGKNHSRPLNLVKLQGGESRSGSTLWSLINWKLCETKIMMSEVTIQYRLLITGEHVSMRTKSS